MVTVDVVAGEVERQLAAGRLRCPACPGLAGWRACPGAGDPERRWDRLAAASAPVAVRGLRGHVCAAGSAGPTRRTC